MQDKKSFMIEGVGNLRRVKPPVDDAVREATLHLQLTAKALPFFLRSLWLEARLRWQALWLSRLAKRADLIVVLGRTGSGKSILLSRLIPASQTIDLKVPALTPGLIKEGGLSLGLDQIPATGPVAIDEAGYLNRDSLKAIVAHMWDQGRLLVIVGQFEPDDARVYRIREEVMAEKMQRGRTMRKLTVRLV